MKWINTNERLPEIGERVVFIADGNNVFGGIYYGTRWEISDWAGWRVTPAVKYWLPLPPLPEDLTPKTQWGV